MTKNFSEIERILQEKFLVGSKITYLDKIFTIINAGKPSTPRGEPKTDIFIQIKSSENDIKELKISIKMDNYEFIQNTLSYKSLQTGQVI